MNVSEKNGIKYITAREGYFLSNNNGLYGVEICLGTNDDENDFIELSLSEWPEDVEESFEEDDNINYKRKRKITQIINYDKSAVVNGFYYDNNFMWLDKNTRVGLVNTLKSAELLGKDTIRIWYDNKMCITLNIEEANILLAIVEMYAAECYNTTAQHISNVNSLTTVEEIENYNYKSGYPEMLHLNKQQ